MYELTLRRTELLDLFNSAVFNDNETNTNTIENNTTCTTRSAHTEQTENTVAHSTGLSSSGSIDESEFVDWKYSIDDNGDIRILESAATANANAKDKCESNLSGRSPKSEILSPSIPHSPPMSYSPTPSPNLDDIIPSLSRNGSQDSSVSNASSTKLLDTLNLLEAEIEREIACFKNTRLVKSGGSESGNLIKKNGDGLDGTEDLYVTEDLDADVGFYDGVRKSNDTLKESKAKSKFVVKPNSKKDTPPKKSKPPSKPPTILTSKPSKHLALNTERSSLFLLYNSLLSHLSKPKPKEILTKIDQDFDEFLANLNSLHSPITNTTNTATTKSSPTNTTKALNSSKATPTTNIGTSPVKEKRKGIYFPNKVKIKVKHQNEIIVVEVNIFNGFDEFKNQVFGKFGSMNDYDCGGMCFVYENGNSNFREGDGTRSGSSGRDGGINGNGDSFGNEGDKKVDVRNSSSKIINCDNFMDLLKTKKKITIQLVNNK